VRKVFVVIRGALRELLNIVIPDSVSLHPGYDAEITLYRKGAKATDDLAAKSANNTKVKTY